MKRIMLVLIFILMTQPCFAENMVVKDGSGSTKYIGSEGSGTSASPYINKKIDEYDPIYRAEQIVLDTYGDTVSVADKNKLLRKWGENDSVGTSATVIMTLGAGETEETILTSNGITTVISDSGSDTGGIAVDFYEGHTYSAGDLTFVIENTDKPLTGTTAATLTTAVSRATRARLTEPATGNIYFYEGGATTGGVPNDKSTIHLIIPAGEIQSQKASTSISSADYWFITAVTASVLEKTGAWAEFRIEIKAASDTYFYPITQWVGVSDTSGTVSILQDGEVLIIPKNHDIRMVAIANTSGIYCAGGMSGPLASIQ